MFGLVLHRRPTCHADTGQTRCLRTNANHGRGTRCATPRCYAFHARQPRQERSTTRSGFRPYKRAQPAAAAQWHLLGMGRFRWAVIGIADLRRRLGHVRVLDGRHLRSMWLEYPLSRARTVRGRLHGRRRHVARWVLEGCSPRISLSAGCHRCVPKVLVAQACPTGIQFRRRPEHLVLRSRPTAGQPIPGVLSCR